MSSSQQPTIAFFGATGGCTSIALALTLKAGFHATALARTPKKLHDLLLTLDVPEATLQSNLTIVQGPAQDLAAVKSTIAPNNVPVSQIIFGIGGTPKLRPNPLRPFTLDNPHVCEEGMSTVVAALRELTEAGAVTAANKPRLLAISTTGISSVRGDIPLAMKPLYHYMLAIPHKDKKAMEDIVIGAARDGVAGGFVLVRPALLTDGAIKGIDKVRAGWELSVEEHKATKDVQAQGPGPAVGYTISRGDVGNWIFERVVNGQGEWDGRCVSLTY